MNRSRDSFPKAVQVTGFFENLSCNDRYESELHLGPEPVSEQFALPLHAVFRKLGGIFDTCMLYIYNTFCDLLGQFSFDDCDSEHNLVGS